jgi:RNA 3'-terminal phosphate cyclase (ATP)
MIEIDGSYGEGGGQILRTALSLALLTARPFRIRKIRAARPKPGLRAQHLKAVEAAAQLGQARVEGARLGSTALSFIPGPIRAGDYRMAVGTAGSVALIFQTLLLPLAAAGAPSRLTLEGGTHVPWSPAFHYLERQFLPMLRCLGVRAEVHLERAGFYPQGGGRMQALVDPAPPCTPLALTDPGALLRIEGLSMVAGLDLGIARRQARRAQQRLAQLGVPVEIALASVPSPGRGTMLLLQAQLTAGSCCHFALGARGKPAEAVAEEVVDNLNADLASGAAVDRYLADQLLLPLALCPGRSRLRIPRVTSHLTTNAWAIRHFLPLAIDICGAEGGAVTLVIDGQGV